MSAVADDNDTLGDYWTFTPAPDFNGDVTLSFAVTDGTTSVSTTATITVDPVDDLPVITSPAATGDEDLWFGIPGVRITDVDTTDAVKVTLSVDPGKGKLGLEGSMQGPTLTLTGTLADINSQLMGSASHYDVKGYATLTAGEKAALTPVTGAQVSFCLLYTSPSPRD